MGTVMLKFLVGGLAGLAIWAVMEPFAPSTLTSHNWASWQGTFIMLLGGAIGLTVGGLDGYTRGGRIHTLRGLGLGLIFGAVGASLGSSIGSALVDMTFGGPVFAAGNIAERIPARIIAFIPIGMFLGAAIGASSLTMKRAVQGLLGGAIGAAIGGGTFDIVCQVFGQAILNARGQHEGEVGIVGRAFTALVLGAMIGLFIGLVERFARSAWLRLSLGRNEGKEWSIDTARTFIGRSESANVPLFGDVNIAPIHAVIDKRGSQYILSDNGSPIGTLVNGQRVGQVALAPGSIIQIGSFALQFLLKGSAAAARGAEAYVGQAQPLQTYPRPGMPVQNMPQPAPQAAPYQPMPQQAPYQGMPQPAPYQPMPQPGAYPQASGQPTQVVPSAASMPTMAYGAQPQPQMMGGFVLVALDGPLLGQRFPVMGPMEVGRDCPAIPMSFDTAASRKHAGLSPAFNGVAVNDFGSTNGTFLNGQRVSQTTASPGDMLKIGSTTFRVESA